MSEEPRRCTINTMLNDVSPLIRYLDYRPPYNATSVRYHYRQPI